MAHAMALGLSLYSDPKLAKKAVKQSGILRLLARSNTMVAQRWNIARAYNYVLMLMHPTAAGQLSDKGLVNLSPW